ncbi:response regulator [bacterium]|nr:response regulator [bacterium]
MQPSPQPNGLAVHDLRHLLALLAADLRLTRFGLSREDEPARRAALAALYARLAAGLAELGDGLAGGARPAARAGAGADLAPRVEALWDGYRQAGRLCPGAARLSLERPLLWPGLWTHWRSLLVNLLENACAAAPEGPVELLANGEGLRVASGGRLPAPALIAALNAGRAPAPRPGGGGQGLGLVLEAVAALGLHLDADCSDGRFTLDLQRLPREAPAVLLVEDDPELRAALAALLRAEGLRVEPRAGDEEPAPNPTRFAAAVADLNLPGASGAERLAAWRREAPELLTVLLTGDSAAARREWPGVAAVLIKPGLGRLRDLLAPLRRGARP